MAGYHSLAGFDLTSTVVAFFCKSIGGWMDGSKSYTVVFESTSTPMVRNFHMTGEIQLLSFH
jgi:hypothetical protein